MCVDDNGGSSVGNIVGGCEDKEHGKRELPNDTPPTIYYTLFGY